MQQPDQTDSAISTTEEVEAHTPIEPKPSPPDIPGASNGQQSKRAAGGFDWLSVSIVVIIAVLFAAAAHLNSQPASSFVPAAVLSATGCGLLITGLRKLRAFKGVGLFEAAVSGLLLALFQFISAFSFPGVLQSLSANPTSQPGFYSTWGLVAFFAMFFSVIGAALGHLAFAPLRPLPARRAGTIRTQDNSTSASDEDENEAEQIEDPLEQSDNESEGQESEELSAVDVEDQAHEELSPANAAGEAIALPPARSNANYAISILLLGLAPFVVGYVFAAAFNFTLNLNQYDPGPFPTLRLLSTLLPWQVPLSINLQAINLSLVWRIPLFFGNPSLFDAQALEPLVLNAAGLACALLTMRRSEQSESDMPSRHSWASLLLLEALLGLALVLPANLWIAFGLHGLLQLPTIAVLLRTLQLLNPLTFILNLITGPLVCMIVGAAIVRFWRNSTNYFQ